jgi:excinuclease UvrABC ATPase subunit
MMAVVWEADSHDVIEVRGARENNLKDVSVDIPKRRLTVFTGVSGSGKSSLVFGTIAAESRRLINETYTAFVQSFMPSLARPDVDSLRNLSAAIIVDQEPIGANARSTVGTATDAYAMLRIVYSRLSTPHVGTSGAFSFNLPEGMCRQCEGLGRVSAIDADALVDRNRSLNQGAITVPGFGADTWYVRLYAESGLLDPDKPLRDYTGRSGTTCSTRNPPRSSTVASTPRTRGSSSRCNGCSWTRTASRRSPTFGPSSSGR